MLRLYMYLFMLPSECTTVVLFGFMYKYVYSNFLFYGGRPCHFNAVIHAGMSVCYSALRPCSSSGPCLRSACQP